MPGLKDDTNAKIKGLTNAYVDTTRYLQWILSHLDENNVVRAKSVVADWIYAGNIQADQIDVTNGKIQAAQIKNLVVGSNVTMGQSATISWSQVTDQPTIPVLPGYITSTKITSTTIESPYITGGVIHGGRIESDTVIDVNSTVNINTSSAGGITFGSGGSIMRDPSGDINLFASRNLYFVSNAALFNCSSLGFFNQYPVAQQTASLLPNSGTSTIKNLEDKINGIID